MSDLVDPDTMQRIRAEETYRLEVRADLAKHTANENPAPSAFLKFFNSAFGLWLLSTVAVGFISFGYAWFDASRKRDAVRHETIAALDKEIRGRFAQWEAITRVAIKKATSSTEIDAAAELLFLPPSATSAQHPRVYEVSAAYRERPLVSLVAELLDLVPPSEQEELSGLLNLIGARCWTDPECEVKTGNLVESMQKIFGLERWGWKPTEEKNAADP